MQMMTRECLKKNLHIRLFRIQIKMHIETRKYVHTHTKKKVFEHLQWCSVCVRDSLQKYIYLFHIQVLVILLFCNPTCWKEGDALKASNPSSSSIIIIIIIRWYFFITLFPSDDDDNNKFLCLFLHLGSSGMVQCC